jgi:HSP20 family molecular chaperone IbpA
MTRLTLFSSPLMLGFDALERLHERAAKASGDGYPPYNIEKRPVAGGSERIRIVLAVAGFARDELAVAIEDGQLVIRGKQRDDEGLDYLHRGIAARQFQKAFILAAGMEAVGASLENGLLAVTLERQEPERIIRHIDITGA